MFDCVVNTPLGGAQNVLYNRMNYSNDGCFYVYATQLESNQSQCKRLKKSRAMVI